MSRLEKLVVDILDLARSDLTENNPEPINIENELSIIKEKFEAILTNNNVAFIQQVTLEKPLVVEKIRLTQILENILSNSIKYCNLENNNRNVKVVVLESATDYYINISDNGLGIPEQKIDQLFILFSRFHSKIADGSGLGMSIVKKHIDAMKGDIQVDSSSLGTTIKMMFPKQGYKND